MNERIREIGLQVGLNMELTMVGGFPNEGLIVAEEFARAIIREFAYDAMDVTGQGEIIQRLAERWGVDI